MEIRLEEAGRRIYIHGYTYSIRDALRSAGAKWDPDARAWWVGASKRKEIETLIDRMTAKEEEPKDEMPGPNAIVAGRGKYRGRPCYIAGREVYSGYRPRVEAIETRDGRRVLLYAMDGSRKWWADRAEVEITKWYSRPQTIEGLKEFAEKLQRGDIPVCPNCGRADCSGAYGDLCEDD